MLFCILGNELFFGRSNATPSLRSSAPIFNFPDGFLLELKGEEHGALL